MDYSQIYCTVDISLKSFYFKKYGNFYLIFMRLNNDIVEIIQNRISCLLNNMIQQLNNIDKFIVYKFENDITTNILKCIKCPIEKEFCEGNMDKIIDYHDGILILSEKQLYETLKYQPVFNNNILKLSCSKFFVQNKYLLKYKTKILFNIVLKNRKNIYFNFRKIVENNKFNYNKITLGNGIIKTKTLIENINLFIKKN